MNKNTEKDDEDKTQKLYEDYVNEANKRQISSSENFDKSILTYSSSGLAISLTFLKDFIPFSKATATSLLLSSWALFVLAIALTTVSFALSYKANELSKDYYRKYLDGDENYFNKKSNWEKMLVIFNFISGLSFILAITFTSLFVALNLKGAEAMTEKKVVHERTQDGLPSASMTARPQAVPPTPTPTATTNTPVAPTSSTSTTTSK
jgi:hypothetical protein